MHLWRLIGAGVTLTAWTGYCLADAADLLVMARPGMLPIIITAPHGGSRVIAGAPPRLRGKVLKDQNTLELAEALADRLNELLGARPYLVAAQFSRSYIDANRNETNAFEAMTAKPFYEAYHRQIRKFVTEIRQNHPGGALLIDIHGQSSDDDGIFRGTRQGTTVDRLLSRFGCPALAGEKSIFGVLAATGYRVMPGSSADECRSEEARYVGGFTVATYGSHHVDGIDAIQLEIGGHLRRSPSFPMDLAKAIAVFHRNFLTAAR